MSGLKSRINKYQILLIAVVVAILVGFFFVGDSFVRGKLSSESHDTASETIVVFKSPLCGCCVKYIAYLKREGLNVEVETVDDMQTIKEKYNIPSDMQSCHTSVVGGYFIEGHMPLEVIEKLLSEKPEIDGISLPGMPAGSPGMPGFKREPFEIYALTEGEASNFTTY